VSRPGGDFDDVDWLDDNSGATVGPSGGPRLPWPRWFTLAVVVLAVAAVAAVLNTVRRTPPPAPPAAVAATPASPSRPAPRTSAPSRSAARPSATSSPVTVVRVGHPLLGITAGWEVFARGVDVLARIQPAAGEVTLTPVPDLRSGGPAALLAGPGQVLIKPWDNVPGYLVRDGQPAEELPLASDTGGRVFPGPQPGQMWVQVTGGDQPVMALATLDGRRLPGSLRVPAGASDYEANADGTGYLLYPAIGGLYEVRPDGLRRISTGRLLTTGPTGWLVTECDERYRCQDVLIRRADGSRRIVPTPAEGPDRSGVISPDGARVAMLVAGPHVPATLYLIDLATGSRRRIGVAVTQDVLQGPVAFSPDGSWLFVITDNGDLAAVESRTGAVHALGVPLPTLSQLIVRPAGH
jgi:hypothetical protein